MDQPRRLTLTRHSRIAAVDAADWNALLGAGPPFLRHEFLAALESSGCVGAAAGWEPCHATLHDAAGRLVAAMPLYLKHHSWGEFVFDWSWADAYRRHGLEYYPKLVSAAPFTPAASPKLLGDADAGRALLDAVLGDAAGSGVSSLHLQFIASADLALAQHAGLSLRKDCQFHWHNRGYGDFDQFLGTFSSVKRKKVRRERRRVREQDISFVHCHGRDIGESDWNDAWQLARTTFNLRGQEPYLSLEFFLAASEALPDMFRLVFAQHGGRRIAAAILYQSSDTLYGRYWGSHGDWHSLHFETCYYQGIDYCIEAGLRRFEPGTQGEHKISRGFEPTATWSAHWIAHPAFAGAIDGYLAREGEHIDEYIDLVHAHAPYRRDAGPRS